MGQKNFIIAFFLIIITLVVIQKLHLGINVVVMKKNLDRFPYKISDMKGIDIPMDDKIIKVLDTDAFIFREYISHGGCSVTIYIGYYGTKKGGRSDHIPEGCYPGAGWSILSEGRAQIDMPDKKWGKSVVLNTLVVKKNDDKQLIYHWYQSDKNKVMISGVQQNLHRFKNRLLLNRDDGAFVRVSTDINDDQAKAREDIEEFIKQVFPLIAEYWPQEEEIH